MFAKSKLAFYLKNLCLHFNKYFYQTHVYIGYNKNEKKNSNYQQQPNIFIKILINTYNSIEKYFKFIIIIFKF